MDPKSFRSVLGTYATGVAVMTCTTRNGRVGAMTVNSFASLSLDPPLVLWSIDNACDQASAFGEASHYAVNILSADQQELSNTLSMPGEDKLSDIPHEKGVADTPLLHGCCARLECEIVDRVLGGDHIILIGRVSSATHCDKEPLIFHGGAYRSLK